MWIKGALRQQRCMFTQLNDWIALRGACPIFLSAFRINRIGKQIGLEFDVTVRDPLDIAQDLIRGLVLNGKQTTSTSGNSVVYTSFTSEGVSDNTLQTFAHELHGAIEQRVQR